MALVLPTSLGNPTIPRPGYASRVATLDSSGPANALIEGSKVAGTAWHRTAEGLQDIGKAYDKLQLDADQKEAKDWLNELIKAKTNLLYGDGTDQNPGYMNLKGDVAVKGAKSVSEQLDKLRQDFLNKTSNKQVANMFDVSSMALVAPDHEEILKHASAEHLVAMNATDDSTIAAATDQMSANPTSEQVIKNSTALIVGSVNAKLNRAGITDPIARNQAIIEAVSASKAQAIQTALVRDPQAGALLYAKWKNQIQGTDQAKLEQSIAQAEDRQMRKQEHAIYMDEAAKRRASNEAQKDWAHQIYLNSVDPTKYPEPDLAAMGNDPRLDGTDLITLMNMQKTADAEDAPSKVSSRTLASIIPRLLANPGDPNRISTYSPINELMANKQLSKSDWKFAASIIDGGTTADGEKMQPYLKSALATALQVIGKPSPITGLPTNDLNAQKLNEWTVHTYQMIEQYKKENKDWHELFQPGNKNYLLSPTLLQTYGVSAQEGMQHLNEVISGGSDIQPSDNLPTDNIPTINGSDAAAAAKAYADLPPGAEYYYTDKDGKTVKLKKAK